MTERTVRRKNTVFRFRGTPKPPPSCRLAADVSVGRSAGVLRIKFKLSYYRLSRCTSLRDGKHFWALKTRKYTRRTTTYATTTWTDGRHARRNGTNWTNQTRRALGRTAAVTTTVKIINGAHTFSPVGSSFWFVFFFTSHVISRAPHRVPKHGRYYYTRKFHCWRHGEITTRFKSTGNMPVRFENRRSVTGFFFFFIIDFISRKSNA